MTAMTEDERDRLLYELPTNVVVAAGAGTGKTHRLTGLYVHLVGGLTEVGRGQPLSPESIVATTFTREAAGEMRTRIEERLRALATTSLRDLTDDPHCASWARELLQTCERRRVDAPSRDTWRRAIDALPRATISTFHAWAGDLVRAFPIEARVPPGFTLLEPDDADAMIARATSHVTASFIDHEDPARRQSIRTLLASGIALLEPAVAGALMRAHEEGIDVADVHVADGEDAVAEATANRARLVQALVDAVEAQRSAKKSTLANAVAQIRAAERAFDEGTAGDETLASFVSLAKEIHNGLRAAAHAEVKRAIDDVLARAVGTVAEKVRSVLTAPERTRATHRVALFARELLHEVELHVAHEKRRARALDFGDVLRKARDLLLHHPSVQLQVASRVRALLVDEFQDTNALQRDLVYLARQRPSAIATRRPGEIPSPASLADTGLFLVGDRKQSVYAFRGADVAVFQQMAVDLAGDEVRTLLGVGETAGEARGRLVVLDANRRSVDDVLAFVNAFSEIDMRGDDALLPVERVVFRPQVESLRAVRTVERTGQDAFVRVVAPLIQAPEHGPLAQSEVSPSLLSALAVVAEIRALLADPSRRALPVPVRRRDVAILIRTYALLPALEFALALHGVEYAVAAGRGLYATGEAGDLEALVRLAIDERDRNALLAVLRGPLVGLADRSLLALCGEHGLALPSDPPSSLDEGEQRRCLALREVLDDLRRHAARLGPSDALARALDRLGFERTLALLPGGEARIRDLRRLLEVADRFDSLASFGRHLARGREGAIDEARGAIFDRDQDAVRVLTIHAAKGLEFPVVFAMQAEHVPRSRNGQPLTVARDVGRLALAVRVEHAGVRDYGVEGRRLVERSSAADRAERQRLTYVALTRARDLLYVVAAPRISARPPESSAASTLDRLLASQPELATRDVLSPTLEAIASAPPEARAIAPAFGEGPFPVATRGAFVVTTALADFAACARRFRLLHVLGLEEHAQPMVPSPVARAEAAWAERRDAPLEGLLPVAPSPIDPRTQGVLAHLALERAPLPAALGAEAHAYANAFLRAEGYDPSDAVGARVADRIVRFLGSRYAATLVGPGVSVERERAFVVELPSGVALRGTIDLLVVRRDRAGNVQRVEVVDYKSGDARRDLDRYALQLRAYAVACTVGSGLGAHVEVVAGVVFLGSGSGDPVWLDEGRSLAGRASIEGIDGAAVGLLAARAQGHFPMIERAGCDRLQCGFRGHCFDLPPRRD